MMGRFDPNCYSWGSLDDVPVEASMVQKDHQAKVVDVLPCGQEREAFSSCAAARRNHWRVASKESKPNFFDLIYNP